MNLGVDNDWGSGVYCVQMETASESRTMAAPTCKVCNTPLYRPQSIKRMVCVDCYREAQSIARIALDAQDGSAADAIPLVEDHYSYSKISEVAIEILEWQKALQMQD